MATETTRVRSDLSLHVLGDGLRRALREVEQELAALAEDSAEEARHGEDDVTMRDRLEHFLLQPLGWTPTRVLAGPLGQSARFRYSRRAIRSSSAPG